MDTDITTLVLVHGMGADRCVWTPVARALEARFRVVAIDLPGHGSEGGRFSVERAPADIDAACRSQPPPVLLVGWSLGGLLALMYLGAEPDAVAGLALVGASIEPRRVVRWLFKHAHWVAPVLETGLSRPDPVRGRGACCGREPDGCCVVPPGAG